MYFAHLRIIGCLSDSWSCADCFHATRSFANAVASYKANSAGLEEEGGQKAATLDGLCPQWILREREREWIPLR